MKEIQTTLLTGGTPTEGYWTKYNKSQTQEKVFFLNLLKELCDTLPKRWRKNKESCIELPRIIFCICLKSYCLKSGRRIIGELELCKRLGYIEKNVHFNSLFNYLRNPKITSILQDLIKVSALPLVAVERTFSGDSSGVGTSVLDDRWSKIRSKYSKHHRYMKVHASFGNLTNIVTSCRITNGHTNDSIMLKELVDETCENFKPEEYSFDKAYLSRNNLETIWSKGALPLIPFKSNTKSKARGSTIWKKMYEFFETNQELFMSKYHLRSNSESGFFMIKQRFGDLTQMRSEVGMTNDILAKVLCHNLCCIIQEIFILGVKVDFAQFKDKLAQSEM